jgi:hypothetical protein
MIGSFRYEIQSYHSYSGTPYSEKKASKLGVVGFENCRLVLDFIHSTFSRPVRKFCLKNGLKNKESLAGPKSYGSGRIRIRNAVKLFYLVLYYRWR